MTLFTAVDMFGIFGDVLKMVLKHASPKACIKGTPAWENSAEAYVFFTSVVFRRFKSPLVLLAMCKPNYLLF